MDSDEACEDECLWNAGRQISVAVPTDATLWAAGGLEHGQTVHCETDSEMLPRGASSLPKSLQVLSG